ncbi:Tfp pilus assembly protein PilV [Kaistia hirudinis]|uniref:Tfp pilus assembly protein PilV n=1 Tax=Kaistia hirudinis TaxID=1293440 RepID=A0A840AJB6_9HYPH|nr:hypothetical protein [Kaistia hirudinis]MBB3929117.1 Tfp pilus assembly protein PilV [Kaistia hirudinis]
MRVAVVLLVSLLGLAGCQSVYQQGQTGSCQQASTTVGGPVICNN